jgi:hypothetical protein
MVAAYAFQAAPRPVTDRPKYRETVHTSLASDPRVFRGSTVSARALPEEQKPKPTLRRSHKPKELESRPFDIPLPPPDREPINLDKHLIAPEVEITVAPAESQTDVFLPEVPELEYVPMKTGIDAETQIYPGDLFQFDLEVAPILDVLVTKTLEQALTEVDDEDELANVAEFKKEWQKRQKNLVVDWERTVAEEKKRAEEKEAVVAAHKAKKKRQEELMNKLACKRAAAEYMAQVVPTATTSLIEAGQFPEILQTPLETDFMPWLLVAANEVYQEKIEAHQRVAIIADKAARMVHAAGMKNHNALKKKMEDQRRKTSEKREAQKGNIRIHLATPKGVIVVGPIRVTETEEIASINERVYAWLQENHPDVAADAEHGVLLYIGDAPCEKSAALFKAGPSEISLQKVKAPPAEEVAPAEEAAPDPAAG